jgi:predicted nuclease of predicted toxin-antitoxin system
MRILLDESLPRTLARELTGHQVQTVQRQGWAGLKNGALLQRAAGEYDVLITGDRNLEYQQNLTRLQIAVVVLAAREQARNRRDRHDHDRAGRRAFPQGQ